VIKKYKCPICKTPLDKKIICESCSQLIVKNPPSDYSFIEGVDEVIVASNYFGVVRKLILDFKFAGKMEYADYIADIMAESLIKHKLYTGVITFVPMYRDKEFQKGYNHAELIAKSISNKIDMEFVKVFEKIRNTREQHGLHKDKRHENLKDSFKVVNIRDEIIIVDDIITTGSTIAELAKVARKSGIKKVTALIAATKIA